MPPQSRGSLPKPPVVVGYQSKSTPNLPTLGSLKAAQLAAQTLGDNGRASSVTSPSQPASITDFVLSSNTSHSSTRSQEEGDEESDEEDEEEEDGDKEDGHLPNLPKRPLYHHQSRSHSYLASAAFAPPFYNRPPTPLPPSPSLTSLLRPNFSSANSRPTTPDHSSDEGSSTHPRNGHINNANGSGGGSGGGGTQTPNSAAAASSLTSAYRTAKPIPRASPKVPTYEYYGFTLYLTASLAFMVYLLWAFLPSPFLHQLGIYYYPNRWWALAIPAWVVMLGVYIYVALAAYNVGYLTLPLQALECFVDEAANVAVVDAAGKIVRNDRPSWRSPSPDGRGKGGGGGRRAGRSGKGGNGGVLSGRNSRQSSLTRLQQMNPELDWRTLWNEGTDAVMDIPIGGVCEILYGGDERYSRFDE